MLMSLKWFDKQIKTYSLIIKDDKVKPYNKQDRLKNYLLKKQFIFRSLNNSTYLGKAKKYALEIVNKKNIDFPDYGDTFVLCAFVYEKLGEYNNSVKYFDLAISYFQSSTHDEKDWRVAYYSLRSALNLAEIELKSAIPKLKQSLKSVLLYKFKDKRIGKEHYIRKAEKFIE
jgi:tetratricopeptide (TPR) repeat protein